VKIRYVRACEPLEALWFVVDDVLVIALADSLDDVTRRRYITQAKREHGIEERRRRLIALIPLAGGHMGGHSKTTAAAVGGGIVAVGVAAAAVLPFALRDDNPPAPAPHAAGPVTPGTPKQHSHPPTRSTPPEPPGRPTPTSSRSPAARPGTGPLRHPVKGALRTSSELTGVKHPIRSIAPTVVPSIPAVASPPGRRQGLCICIRLVVRVRIGCRQNLQGGTP
jgi:hypothetical protein